MSPTIGSLFTGIGGLDLGLEWAGLGPVRWQVEIDAHARRTLARHWPDVPRYRYVQSIPAAVADGRVPRVAILAGGFPCQDLSQANPGGAGLDGARSGLWWWMLDCIDAIQPRVVIIENVSGLVRRGLDIVVGELEHRGFEVEATRLRASDVGAPHRRERLFVLAYANSSEPERGGAVAGMGGLSAATQGEGVQRQRDERAAGCCGALAYAHRGGLEEQREQVPTHEQGARRDLSVRRDGAVGDAAGAGRQGGDISRRGDAAEPSLGHPPDGLSQRLVSARWPAMRGAPQHSWEPPRVVDHYRGRREQLRGLGNAVVPHCAYVVGMRVRQRLGLA